MIDLEREVDRLTQFTGASKVRVLTAEERTRVAATVTPPERIPRKRYAGRVCVPSGWDRQRWGRVGR